MLYRHLLLTGLCGAACVANLSPGGEYGVASGWIAKGQGRLYDADSFDSSAGENHPNRRGTHYQLNSRQGAYIIAQPGCALEDASNRAYAILERTLAGIAGEAGNLEVNVRYGRYDWAPEDRSTVAWASDTAEEAAGLLPARPADVTALGWVYAELSAKLPGQDFEQVTELSHTIALGEHLSVQPDIQYIRHVGAVSNASDARLFTLRLSASY